MIARFCCDALQQRNVALDAGDELGLDGIFQPQLKQRTDSVGIAVEDIKLYSATPLGQAAKTAVQPDSASGIGLSRSLMSSPRG